MIHKFSMFGENIVLDVNSGAVHLFDDLSYELLDFYGVSSLEEILSNLEGKYSRDSIKGALQEIDELKENGLLFSEDTYRELAGEWMKNTVLKALCIHISHDCNMRCRYCFASTGDFGTSRKLMSPETGYKAIDFLISKSEGRRNLEVDFFGGEPLLNFETVRKITEYALKREKEHNKKFRFTLTTNGLLLDEDKKQFINEYMDNIVLSIDGRETVNDRMRTRIDGTGTYRDILPKMKDMADSRGQDRYYVRGTFTRENPDFSNDVLHLADMGFEQVSVEPVVAAKDSGFDIRREDLPVLFREYEKLAAEYYRRRKEGKGFNFFHFMLDLDKGPCITKRIKGCGSGYEYMAVTPEGDIYPCHQFVGMEEFKMGNVNNGNGLNNEVRDLFRDSTIYTKNRCIECWARFFCSGGCAANAFQFNSSLAMPYEIGCELERKRVECALWVKVCEHADKEEKDGQ